MSDGYLFIVVFLMLMVGLLLFMSLDFQMDSRKRDGVIIRLFERNTGLVEMTILIFMPGSISALILTMAVEGFDTDPVLAIDSLLFVPIILIVFGYGTHRRLRHFHECLTGDTDMSPGVPLDTLEPVLYAGVTIGAWILSIIILAVALLLPNTEQFRIISQVMLHYGLGGTLFIFSPTIFAVYTLIQQRTESYENVHD